MNIPVPGQIARHACDLARELPNAHARPRGSHTLGVKRLVNQADEPYSRLEAKTRELLAGQPAFETRITSIEYFADAPTGSSPVVHFHVESAELERLHQRLTTRFDPVDEIEGKGYSPHITIARGGSLERAKNLVSREIEAVTWTVDELIFWDSKRNQSVSSVSLPA
nr:2'-5' RNA ligase family protein [Halovenus rubra]